LQTAAHLHGMQHTICNPLLASRDAVRRLADRTSRITQRRTPTVDGILARSLSTRRTHNVRGTQAPVTCKFPGKTRRLLVFRNPHGPRAAAAVFGVDEDERPNVNKVLSLRPWDQVARLHAVVVTARNCMVNKRCRLWPCKTRHVQSRIPKKEKRGVITFTRQCRYGGRHGHRAGRRQFLLRNSDS
jgi:hypothetical protein